MAGHRQMVTDQVEADLPITPMLDMSFQLLAFFIMTFVPAPTEAQIALSLPPADSGPNNMSMPDPTAEVPTKYVVRVLASETGTIKNITIREEGSALEPKDIGADVRAAYPQELQGRLQQLKGKPAKLTLELDEKLLEGYVIQFVDGAIQAGYTDISPVPTNVRTRH